MGSFGVLAFDNDEAGDWADRLEYVDDLSLVEAALQEVEHADAARLPTDSARRALAACEVLARLRGNVCYTNVNSEPVDRWVAAHRIDPSSALLERAQAAIDRILAPGSDMWAVQTESDTFEAWRRAVDDLRRRLRG